MHGSLAYVTDASELFGGTAEAGALRPVPPTGTEFAGQKMGLWADDATGKQYIYTFGKAMEVGNVRPGSSMFGSVVHDIGSGASTLGKAAAAASKAAASVIGKDPLLALTKSVLSGERLDRALMSATKQATANLKSYGPYAQMVASMVPGLGTGVAGAIGAATALANGQRIDDALLAGAKGALPGGPIAQAAFDTAVGVAKGGSLTSAALQAARSRLPPGPAQAAFDVGLSMARGQSLQNAALATARSQLPPVAQTALDTGMAAAQGRLTEQAAKLARAQLPPAAQSVFDAGVQAAKGKPIQDVVANLAKVKGADLMRPLSRPEPFDLLKSVPQALSLLPSNVDQIARTVLNNPSLRSMNVSQLAQHLNVPPTVARSAVASVIDVASRAGAPAEAMRKLRPAQHLESMIPMMGHSVDKLLAHMASRAAPSAGSPRPRRKKPVFARHVHRYIMRLVPQAAPLMEAGALDSSGNKWLVKSGDTPSGIAQSVVKDWRRYPELLAANPTKPTNGLPFPQLNFKSLLPGEVLNLPVTWVAGGVALPTSTPALPTSFPTAIPTTIPGTSIAVPTTFMGIPIPSAAPAPAPGAPGPKIDTSTFPSDQIVRVKIELAAWGVKERAISPAGYGTNALDLDGSIDERFTSAVRSYQAWAKGRGESLRTDGVLDAPTVASIDRYTQKAASTALGAPAPSATPAPSGGAGTPTMIPGTSIPMPTTIPGTNIPIPSALPPSVPLPTPAQPLPPGIPGVTAPIPTAVATAPATPQPLSAGAGPSEGSGILIPVVIVGGVLLVSGFFKPKRVQHRKVQVRR